MSYVTPADVGISDNRAAHLARNSKEPGTDYKTAMNTDLRAPFGGRVQSVDNNSAGPEGRRISMLLDDGNVVDWIHLQRITAKAGDRFDRAERGIALSGASGYGRDRYYGPHVHVTLRDRLGLPYSQTLNFENFIGQPTSSQGFTKAQWKGIQRALNTFGQGLFVDGIPGPKTVAAIKRVQKILGVPVDGLWGPTTNGAYNAVVVTRRPLIRQGSKGALVKLLQKKLGIKQDGIFGPATRLAVIAFQKKHKLYQDGIVGTKTWQKLGY